MADGKGTLAHSDRVRRFPDAQDLPAAVRQLLRVHILHRLLQGQVRGPSRGLRAPVWTPAGRGEPNHRISIPAYAVEQQ
jgi:hypothetical protein